MRKKENDLDVTTLLNGPIVMYHNSVILDEDIGWYDQNNYRIIDINTSNWTPSNFHEKVKTGFDFPDYYGKNMNALIDCLSDLYNKKFKGLLIVLRNFEELVELDRSLSEDLLDIIARLSRRWLVTNQFLIGIVQSNDPDLHFEPVGGVRPYWNGNEFFDEERRNKIIPR